jgi:hypothetical protein
MLEFGPKSVWTPRRKQSPSRVPLIAGESLAIADTISESAVQDTACDGEREVIASFAWKPQSFTAITAVSEGDADLAIKFPSPKPQGNPDWDTAVLDWYFARDRAGRIKTAPAVIVLDILQGGNLVSGYIARTLAKNGLHAFILHLPQNGRRMKAGAKHDWNFFLPSLRQGASDARRARDVVASLPMVAGGVSLQGTSLGGFVATMAGSIDAAFDSTILALTGGDVFGILSRGKMDAARVRGHLRDIGYTDDKLRDWLWQIEPLRIAHRLNANRTWLFSARYDQVVPTEHGKMLAQAIDLDWSHHRQLAGCHYTCAINARRFLSEMIRAIPKPPVERQSA